MRHNSVGFLLAAATLGVAASIACNGSAGKSAAASDGKVPITTESEEARKEYLIGRDLSEKLLAQDSLQHFDKAIALDPDFATAELGRANSSQTAKEFFDHLNKAVSLADHSTEGERLQILAAQAGANNDVVAQKADLEKLVTAFPNDERAQFALAGYYFGQQELDQAIAHETKATQIAPTYSTAYNLLGYMYRQQGDYPNAEQAFKKYVELLPTDPNPYDSYGELLLKMGRFDDSITQYRKALAIDPHFTASHFGIAADLMYMDKSADANAELRKLIEQSRSDGDLRLAYFGMAVVASDTGKLEQAAQAMDNEYAVAEKKNDMAAMSADLQAKGLILTEARKLDAAAQTFEKSLQLIETSNQSQEIKDNAKLGNQFNLAAVAIAKQDYASAKNHSEQYRQGAEASKNSAQIKLAHELAGRIALAQKDYDKAIAELEQGNDQNPRNLFRLGEAYLGKGDSAKAREYCLKAAQFNPLPQLNFAFIRTRAQKMAAGKA